MAQLPPPQYMFTQAHTLTRVYIHSAQHTELHTNALHGGCLMGHPCPLGCREEGTQVSI